MKIKEVVARANASELERLDPGERHVEVRTPAEAVGGAVAPGDHATDCTRLPALDDRVRRKRDVVVEDLLPVDQRAVTLSNGVQLGDLVDKVALELVGGRHAVLLPEDAIRGRTPSTRGR